MLNATPAPQKLTLQRPHLCIDSSANLTQPAPLEERRMFTQHCMSCPTDSMCFPHSRPFCSCILHSCAQTAFVIASQPFFRFAEGKKSNIVVMGEKGRAQLVRVERDRILATMNDINKLRITFSQVRICTAWCVQVALCDLASCLVAHYTCCLASAT